MKIKKVIFYDSVLDEIVEYDKIEYDDFITDKGNLALKYAFEKASKELSKK